MKKANRRTFLKLLGISSFSGVIPHRAFAKTQAQDDVTFLRRKHKLYDIFRRPFNKRIKTQPKVIAVCRNENGVQQAVRYANKLGLSIAIKSGGHSFEGFSLNQDGLVIDLSEMNHLSLHDKKHLIAEPAVRLSQLYSYCIPKGRLLPSGSCGTLGLSGITLGGGYGLFSRQFGLTSDHLIGLRMVDAKGNVVDSNDEPELLWACRGGGNGNFGVVTQLRYNTVAAPETLHQHRFRTFNLTPAKATEIVKFWFEQTKELPLHAFSAFIFSGTSITIMLTSTEHDEKMKKILNNLDAKMDKNANLKPDPLGVGIKYYYGMSQPLNFKNISSGFYKDFNDVEAFIEKVFTIVSQSAGTIFQINTLGGAINHSPMSDSSAYPHRNVNYLSEAQCYWAKESDEPRHMNTMKKIQAIITDNGIKQHYVNYPDLNITNFQQAYYGASHTRLAELKLKLDPKNRFSFEQGIQALPVYKK